jgi:hypothetical protein
MAVDEAALLAAIPVGSNFADAHLVRAIIEAYEAAKPAPVSPAMVTEEEVARSIYKSMGFSYDYRTVAPNGPYGAWAEAVSHARAVLALVQPALAKAVEAEREAAAQEVMDALLDGFGGDFTVEYLEGYQSGMAHAIAIIRDADGRDIEREITEAAAIRSRAQESETGA